MGNVKDIVHQKHGMAPASITLLSARRHHRDQNVPNHILGLVLNVEHDQRGSKLDPERQ